MGTPYGLFKAQAYAMRPPEVFLAQPCSKVSQVWAIAATILCWMTPGILGAWDCPHPLINDSWCMAKPKRLFPHWYSPSPVAVEGHVFTARMRSVRSLSIEVPELHAIAPFEQEMERVEMLQQMRDLLPIMLVPDPSARPSATAVLASKEFRAFEHLDATT
ncbi:hypothetical protein BJY01DRAFT_241388 [Aspergillus pseudoustus]|uniref:Protein kinase domain-containing protein n=1 Tax=Aspergillus pseudoustus TaxID=1810923 RepID=A0ABR4IHI0_9EURO